jgi:hypothetical protein
LFGEDDDDCFLGDTNIENVHVISEVGEPAHLRHVSLRAILTYNSAFHDEMEWKETSRVRRGPEIKILPTKVNGAPYRLTLRDIEHDLVMLLHVPLIKVHNLRDLELPFVHKNEL